jgi:hypothetical protein
VALVVEGDVRGVVRDAVLICRQLVDRSCAQRRAAAAGGVLGRKVLLAAVGGGDVEHSGSGPKELTRQIRWWSIPGRIEKRSSRSRGKFLTEAAEPVWQRHGTRVWDTLHVENYKAADVVRAFIEADALPEQAEPRLYVHACRAPTGSSAATRDGQRWRPPARTRLPLASSPYSIWRHLTWSWRFITDGWTIATGRSTGKGPAMASTTNRLDVLSELDVCPGGASRYRRSIRAGQRPW